MPGKGYHLHFRSQENFSYHIKPVIYALISSHLHLWIGKIDIVEQPKHKNI